MAMPRIGSQAAKSEPSIDPLERKTRPVLRHGRLGKRVSVLRALYHRGVSELRCVETH